MGNPVRAERQTVKTQGLHRRGWLWPPGGPQAAGSGVNQNEKPGGCRGGAHGTGAWTDKRLGCLGTPPNHLLT